MERQELPHNIKEEETILVKEKSLTKPPNKPETLGLLKMPTYRALCIIFLIGLLIFAISMQQDRQSDYQLRNNGRIIDAKVNSFDAKGQTAEPSEVIIEWKLTEDISCHGEAKDDALPQLGSDFTPPPKSIFMHETSCRGGLNSRQACAVESAARAHPDWQVHMLFSGPVTKYVLEKSCLAKLRSYDNVKLMRIYLKEYAKNTPVQSLIESAPFGKSNWRVEHSSDALRYLSLYKFGGVYMDSDVVVLKSFGSLASNWAARESTTSVDSGLMAFSRDALGRKMANATIEDFKTKYDPKKWGNNGPGVITRVVKKMCSKNKEKWMQGCDGFVVYPPEVFYPIYFTKNKQYFEADRELTTSSKTYAHHLWNALTRNYDVPKTSPYAKLAKEYCPKVYAMYGDKFGV